MRTVADLRRAMIEETENLAPRVRFADVRRRARRRRFRWGVTSVVAALAPLLAGLLINGLQPAAPPLPAPTPRPAPTVPISVHPSFPPVGDVITTDVRVGNDSELVFWFHEGPFLSAGLRNTATGTVRSLAGAPVTCSAGTCPGGGEHGFDHHLGQIDDRLGAVVDYGLFVGDAARIIVSTGGQQVDAELAPWSVDPSYIVFWVRHGGTPLPPTGAPEATGTAQPRFTAYNRAGEVIATAEGRSQRTDGGLIAEDRPRVGDLIRTGTPTASGRELVLWFVGDDKSALLKAGEWHPGSGTATELNLLGMFARPPFSIGFYRGYHRIDGPGGTQITLGVYVGPATRVVMAHPAEGVTTGSARWSVHPELVICWAANVPAATAHEISAVAFDANGRVVAATNFRN
jgi:hypothetical protein